MKIKNWKSFNESVSENLLEVLITLEEIQTRLNKSLNPLSIGIIDVNKILFEYHCGAVFNDNIGKDIKYSHYEKVEISDNDGNFIIKFDKVVDKTFPHYTPKEISFDNLEELIKFLKERYIENSWMIEKKKKGRYFVNDGISDIPDSWR